MSLGVHFQIVMAVALAVLCYTLVVVCVLCCRRKKKSVSSVDREAVLLSSYPPTVTLTPSQCAHPIKQQYEELDGDVLDFPLSKSSSSPSEDDLCALPSDTSPTRSPGLLLSPGSSVPVRRLSSPALPCPPNKSPVHGRASLPSLTKLSLMSRSKRAKGRRSTVSGESFLCSESSSLNSDPQVRDGAQYGAVSRGSTPTPLLHFSLLFSSAHGTLVVNVLGVSGTRRKRGAVFVRASLPPLCPSPQPLPSRRRSLSPELHSQSVVLQVGPMEELHLCTLRLAVYCRDFSGLREAMLGLVEMPCEMMDLTPDTTCTFTREITPTKSKLKKNHTEPNLPNLRLERQHSSSELSTLLEAYKTNSDPKITAGYFMDAVATAGGCAARVRLDLGTENGYIANFQRFFHDTANQETDSVSLGPSTGNQRIERWWLTLRSECVQFWIDFFDKVREDGYFSDNFLDKSLIQFCFMELIQEELNEIALTWNNHRVRQVHNSRSPHGRPSILHAVPHLYGGRDYLHAVPMEKASICLEECSFKDFPCDEDVFKICVDLMSVQNLSFSNVYKTLDVYVRLRELINHELQQ